MILKISSINYHVTSIKIFSKVGIIVCIHESIHKISVFYIHFPVKTLIIISYRRVKIIFCIELYVSKVIVIINVLHLH